MSEPYIYNGKPLDEYDLWALGLLKAHLENQEKARLEASKHSKFDKTNSKKAMDFPSPNPEFLKLKEAVKEAIRKKQNA